MDRISSYYWSILLLLLSCIILNAGAFTTHTHKKPYIHHYGLAINPLKATSNNNDDKSIDSFFSNIGLALNSRMQQKPTEEELLRLQKRKKLLELEEKEVERAQQVRKDAIPYLILLILQFTPLLGNDRIISVLYFFGVAVSTVYVGGRQVTIEESEIVKKENALAAPIGASVSIGFLYFLIKMGLDPGILYAIAVSAFGALSISDIGVPLLRNILPDSFASAKIKVSKEINNILKFDEGVEELPLDGLTTLLLGIVCTIGYWSPIAMEQKFILSNFLAWSLAMTSLGAISLGSFQTATILLAGLFFYDIFWVFGTDVMMTVATKVEAPVKFLFTAPPPPPPSDINSAPTIREYNFSVLGLGDVVIPGLFIRFMSKMDSVLKPTSALSYFHSATLAYALGLGVCFAVNEITGAGQPALLYLNPACIGSALVCGAVNGQLQDVWSFEEVVREGGGGGGGEEGRD